MLRLGNLKERVVEFIALALAAGIVYFIGLFWLERASDSRRARLLVLAAALLFRATLLPLWPSLSDDFYRYRWEGRVQAAGINPYTVRPDDPKLAALRDPYWNLAAGKDSPTSYGPLAELFYRLNYWLARQEHSPAQVRAAAGGLARQEPLPSEVGSVAGGPATVRSGSVIAMKVAYVLLDLGTLLLILRLLALRGKPVTAAAIYAWNPLIVVEFAASSHLDSLVVLLLVAAIILIIRQRPALSMFALASAAAVKYFPVIFLPLLTRRIRHWVWFAVLLGLWYVPFLSAGQHLLDGVRYYYSQWINNPSLYALWQWLRVPRAAADGIFFGVTLGMVSYLTWRRTDTLRAVYLVAGTFLLLSPNLFPWYLTVLVPFLCFFPNPAWLLLTVTSVLSYEVLIDFNALGIWHGNPYLRWLEYAPFYVLLIGWYAKRARVFG